MSFDQSLHKEWLDFVFKGPAWDANKPYAELSPEGQAEFHLRADLEIFWYDDPKRLLSFLTHTFLNAGTILPQFAPQRVGEGLWYLMDSISLVMRSKDP